MNVMADSDALGRIKLRYDERRNRAANDRKSRIEAVRRKVPRISEIDQEISRLGMENISKISKDPENVKLYTAQLKAKYDILYSEKNRLIAENGIAPNYAEYEYQCKKCSDTGYTPEGRRCKCFEQQLINEEFEMGSVLEAVKKERFDTFSYKYYSAEEKNGTISERANMERIFGRARRLCQNFGNETKGLIFSGVPGLGKTFLANCIAGELMSQGKTVVFMRAVKLFRMMDDYKFGRETDRDKLALMFGADLLIIDDLGTEGDSANNRSYLDEIVNERVLNGRKLVITTNLTIEEMHQAYSKRFVSRVMEYFIYSRFFGSDIRSQML
jgi:DNA replication protein DnaC